MWRAQLAALCLRPYQAGMHQAFIIIIAKKGAQSLNEYENVTNNLWQKVK